MTANGLMKAAEKRKCVSFGGTSRHIPAAFIASMQFHRVLRMLPMLKLYKPKKT